MDNYSLNNLIGKNIVVTKDTKLYRYNSGGKSFRTIKKGQSAGKLDSFSNATGVLKLLFNDIYNIPYYFNVDKNVSIDQLKNQGTKTVSEQEKADQKEAAEKTLFEKNKIEYYLRKYGIYVLGTFILAAIIKKKL
jgi:hypothetical protein